jgi:dTDP-4-dehydrorhamnose reductase
MGTAIKDVFEGDYCVVGKNSKDFEAAQFQQTRKLVEEARPDIVINTVAFVGIDACEKEPEKALCLNALYPKFLSELSNEMGFLLVHFSTDAVFNDSKEDFYNEDDLPSPLNMYGFTKYGGDCFIQNIAREYYIFRLSILFGLTSKNSQFVEKMLQRVKEGQKILRIADDIIASPTYSRDVALEIKKIVGSDLDFGLYHVANLGEASLYDLMEEILRNLNLKVKLERASHKDFPSLGIKNTYTPIRSKKIAPLRDWREAVKDYCLKLKF